MNKVFVIPNMDKHQAVEVAKQVTDYLLQEGFELLLCDELMPQLSTVLSDQICYVPEAAAYIQCDFVITIGGDGTLLHAAPKAAAHKKPVLGINNGKLGFMTEIDTRELHLLHRIRSGQYKTEDRMMLDVSVIDTTGAEILCETVLNDAVITKGTFAKLIDIAICVDGDNTMEFRGDGVIICTATGSTAYSLSAGGPILEPNAKCIAVTPICPHALTIKSFVLSAERTVSIPEKTEDQCRYLFVDGSDAIELKHGEEIIIKRSAESVKFIRITNQGFYDKINGKLVREVM